MFEKNYFGPSLEKTSNSGLWEIEVAKANNRNNKQTNKQNDKRITNIGTPHPPELELNIVPNIFA